MFLIDDLNNLNTGSDGYEPGQQFSNSYKDNPLNDDDSYTSINPNYNIELDDDDAYPSVNPRPSSQFEDSGYESANKDNFSDPEFQNYYKGQQRGGLMDQARRAVKRGRATVQRTIPKKIGEDLLGDKQAFMDSSPENRERVKELAKERARNALSDNIGDGLGKGFKEGIKKEECEMCGWAKSSLDGRIPLELDHINGDHHDNRLINLRILCPNCHSLQPTHRGKNKK
jgi:hypothetical protein